MSEPTTPKKRNWYLKHFLDACFIGGISIGVGLIAMFTLFGVAGLAQGVAEAHKRAEALETRVGELEKQLETGTVRWSAWPLVPHPAPLMSPLVEVRR
jgi:hypothetical protein